MNNTRIIIKNPGGPKALQLVQEDLPEPQDGEIRVKVLTTGVSFSDIMLREGAYEQHPGFPVTPGADIVGIVDKLGPNVSELNVGDKVIGLTDTGGYAKYVCVPANDIVKVPSNIDPILIEPIALNYLAAYQMLHRLANIDKSETILIHGAAGGVGSAIAHLGQQLQLKMYGSVSARKHQEIREFGVEPIDYRKQYVFKRIMQLTEGGVDVVFDPIGGLHWRDSYQCLRPCGRLIIYGTRSQPIRGFFKSFRAYLHKKNAPVISLLKLLFSNKSVIGYNATLHKQFKPNQYREDLTKLVTMVADGTLKPLIADTFVLEEAHEAHTMMQKSKHIGRIVLICNEDAGVQTQVASHIETSADEDEQEPEKLEASAEETHAPLIQAAAVAKPSKPKPKHLAPKQPVKKSAQPAPQQMPPAQKTTQPAQQQKPPVQKPAQPTQQQKPPVQQKTHPASNNETKAEKLISSKQKPRIVVPPRVS